MKTLVHLSALFLLYATLSGKLFCQWSQTGGPCGTPVWSLAASGTFLFAATDHGVCRSTDNGLTWTTYKLPQSIRSLAVLGTTLFAGAHGGIYRSTDNGSVWTLASNKGMSWVDIAALCPLGKNLFAGTIEGIFRSTDGGETWVSMSAGLPSTRVTELLAVGSMLFASTSGAGGGVFRSEDSGATWREMDSGLTDSDVYTLVADGTTLFAGTSGGRVFRSADNGAQWTGTQVSYTSVISLAVGRSAIFAGTSGAGVFCSTDNGANWNIPRPGLADEYVNTLLFAGSNLLAGSMGGVFRSTDDAADWSMANRGLTYRRVNTLTVSSNGATLFAGCKQGGVFRTMDEGTSWDSQNLGLKDENGIAASVYALVVKGTTVIAGTDGYYGMYRSSDNGMSWDPSYVWPGGNVSTLYVAGNYVFAGANGGGIYISMDDGLSWGETGLDMPSVATVNAFAQMGPYLFAGTFGSGVYRSTDYGSHWSAASTGLPVPAAIKCLVVSPGSGSTSRLIAGTEGDGAYVTTDNGTSWIAVNNGLPQHTTINALQVVGGTVFAGTNGDNVFVSTDNGGTWSAANGGLTDITVNAFVLSPSGAAAMKLFAGTTLGGVFCYGSSSSVKPTVSLSKPATASLGTPFWVEVRVGDPNAVAGLYGISFKLTSNKPTCTYVDGSATVGTFADAGVLTFFQKASTQAVDMAVSKTAPPGMSGSGVLAKAQFVSSVGGTVRFTMDGLSAVDQNGMSIPFDTTGVTILISGPVARPVGTGPYQMGKPFWVEVQVGGPDTVKGLYGIAFKLKSEKWGCTYVDGSAMAGSFLGTSPQTFFQQVDAQTVGMGIQKKAPPGVNGSGVVAKAQFVSSVAGAVLFTLQDVSAVDQNGASIPLGTEPLSIEFIVTATEEMAQIPTSFGLSQNYPNPFNPATMIRYELPKSTYVSLKVYSALGQVMGVLVDSREEAGYHQVRWNAGNLPTGVYFYRLQAGDFVESRRMILVK